MARAKKARKTKKSTGGSSKSGGSSSGGAGFFDTFTLAVVVLAVCGAVASHGQIPSVAPMIDPGLPEQHDLKPYSNFTSFYPFYLSQHQEPTSRLLHVIGTSIIVLLTLLMYRPMVWTMAITGAVGYMACEATRGFAHGFVEFGLMMAVFVAFNLRTMRRTGVELLVIGYGFAWVGHFFFELNKPATFIYPAYSLMGDFHMWYDYMYALAQPWIIQLAQSV